MTRTILAKFSDAVMKLCDSVDFVRQKHSLFRPSHSLLIISSMCFSASPRGFSLWYNSLYDPSSPFCDSSCMRRRTNMLDHALFGQYWRGCWPTMLWTWMNLSKIIVSANPKFLCDQVLGVFRPLHCPCRPRASLSLQGRRWPDECCLCCPLLNHALTWRKDVGKQVVLLKWWFHFLGSPRM